MLTGVLEEILFIFVPCSIWRRESTFVVAPLKQLMCWTVYVVFVHYMYHQHEGT